MSATFVFGGAEEIRWIKQSKEDRLARCASADDISGHPINRGIKEIERYKDALPCVASGDFQKQRAHRIIKNHNVIAVPAHGAAGVQEEPRMILH